MGADVGHHRVVVAVRDDRRGQGQDPPGRPAPPAGVRWARAVDQSVGAGPERGAAGASARVLAQAGRLATGWAVTGSPSNHGTTLHVQPNVAEALSVRTGAGTGTGHDAASTPS